MTARSTEAWDQDLPFHAVRLLSPPDKRARFKASLTRKVEFMEAAVADGNRKELGGLPLTRMQLRTWKDAALGMWPWANRRLDYPDGPYPELAARFLAAVEVLKSRSTGDGESANARA